MTIWNEIGVRAAIGNVEAHSTRIQFYAELSKPKRVITIVNQIEANGLKIHGVINPCPGPSHELAAAAYLSVKNGGGMQFNYCPEDFNTHMLNKAREKISKSTLGKTRRGKRGRDQEIQNIPGEKEKIPRLQDSASTSKQVQNEVCITYRNATS